MENILYITDRQREAILDGEDIKMQQYSCGTCSEIFTITAKTSVVYCPCCGTEFEKFEDVSA